MGDTAAWPVDVGSADGVEATGEGSEVPLVVGAGCGAVAVAPGVSGAADAEAVGGVPPVVQRRAGP
jgi:hypothetical protein